MTLKDKEETLCNDVSCVEVFKSNDVKEAVLEFEKEIKLHSINGQVSEWNIKKIILQTFGDFEK